MSWKAYVRYEDFRRQPYDFGCDYHMLNIVEGRGHEFLVLNYYFFSPYIFRNVPNKKNLPRLFPKNANPFIFVTKRFARGYIDKRLLPFV